MIDNNIKNDIKCIIIGNLFFNIICIIITIIMSLLNIINSKLCIYIIIGLIIGFIISIFYIIHMANKIDEALYFDNESNVKSQMVKNNIIRYILFVVVVIHVSKFINPYMGLAIIVGFYGMKIGAYTTPFLKKYIK